MKINESSGIEWCEKKVSYGRITWESQYIMEELHVRNQWVKWKIIINESCGRVTCEYQLIM